MIPQDTPRTDTEASNIAESIADFLVLREGASLGTNRDDLICNGFAAKDIDRSFTDAQRIAAKRMTREIHDDIAGAETAQNPIYAKQDGADIYFNYSPGNPSFEQSVRAPFKVADDDMTAAQKARQWFEQTHGGVIWE